MESGAKVVVRYVDGRVVKGYAQDFDPDTSFFHLYENPTGASEEIPLELQMEDLKAVFFVRTFEGDPHCRAQREFIKGAESYGDRVEVTVGDGEVVRGFRIDHCLRRSGFFLLPPDPEGDDIMIFVISKAVRDLSFFPQSPSHRSHGS